ncbi:MAG TPA: patatin-like phospholipase family protein [Paracoccaceae bacterium]|nr:patatin-like phospholipase family protein [Paracoccaceae bacterium]
MIRPAKAAATALALLAACAPPVPRDPSAPPQAAYETAEIPGFPYIRIYHDAPFRPSREVVEAYLRERREAGLATDRFDILALSGGGPDGAFGAGFLKGWTENGDRPEFDIVTGISTGALIAPFAFLGPDYDEALRRFYTGTTTGDILTFTILAAIAGGTAVADTEPLRQILAQEVTPEFTARIAAEHRRGRRLLVGTTNIDSQRPVIWDLGAIAVTGRPDAPDLIRKVMLASAAIPGAFPPVLFDVTSDGRTYQEVHVDGGVTLSLFVYPPSLDLGEITRALGVPEGRKTFYLIRNAKLRPEYSPPLLGLVPIAERAVSTLIKVQTIGNLLEIERLAARDGFEIRLASVPESFATRANELFDPAYMSALYALGHEEARNGTPWSDNILGLEP